MENTTYKLDEQARLWMRSPDQAWRLTTPDETDALYRAYPEIAVQALWIGEAILLAA